MGNAKRDDNYIPTLIAVSNADGITPVTLYADPTTHRLLVSSSGVSGSQIAAHIQRDQFTSTNNQTEFLASQTIVKDLFMMVNGVVQLPGGGYDYSIIGNTYTLTEGVPAGLQVILCYIF